MKSFLTQSFQDLSHPFCLGFDPSVSDLHPFLVKQLKDLGPELFLTSWYAATAETTLPKVKSLKLQAAFFEAFGVDGHKALQKIVQDAKSRGIYVILDAKRGDIASTMHAYGQSAFETIGADALTILPWMGVDVLGSLKPWLERGHGVYTVWLSSNESGRVLQESALNDGETLAEKMLKIWEHWIERHSFGDRCGYVVGATRIPAWVQESLGKKTHSLLMPGLGAQGGTITPTLKALHTKHPASIFPLSRGILKPSDSESVASWSDYSKGVAARLDHFIRDWHRI